MDRSSLIGIISIAIVVSAWVFFQSLATSERDVTPEATKAKKITADSVRSAVEPETPKPTFVNAPERIVTVETDLVIAKLSSVGATIRSLKLKEFQPWYRKQKPDVLVDLIQPGVREFGFSFFAKNGSKIADSVVDFVWETKKDQLVVSGGNSVTVTGKAVLANGGSITRSYTFKGESYAILTNITLDGLEDVIPNTNRNVQLKWKKGIRYQEHSSVDESNSAVVMVSSGGDVEELDATEYVLEEESVTGSVDFLATRTKYFAVAMVPTTPFDGRVWYSGTRYGAKQEGYVEKYSMIFQLPYSGGKQSNEMLLYAGPMHYDTLSTYGLTEIMDFGFKWIIKPIGEYFMLPTMKFIHNFIPNWGIAIIIFALFLKALLYPLSITQLKSAQKMQLVAPLMTELREKYKDDTKTQHQETMKVYSEYGINPAGGCLPLLLQMPFLYALYAVLNLNVELRQAAFLPIWITDLSIPDVILSLPFKLPLIGIDKFSGLALLMGATLFIQQKQVVTDPRQKAMVYMMPVMLTLIFSTLPAGLNLYYFVFNVVGISQQIWMSKFSKKKLTLADLRKSPKKEGWLQKKMKEAQNIAEAQGKAVPGQRPIKKVQKGKKR